MALSPSRKITSDKKHSSKRIKLYTESFNNLDDCINSNFNYESMRTNVPRIRIITKTKKNKKPVRILSVSYTHLTLPTKRIV